MIITIDGPAGSGKSTIARQLAQELGGMYLNSGAFYRAITFHLLEKGGPISTLTAGQLESVKGLKIMPSPLSVFLNGRELGDRIYSDVIDQSVSGVSSFPEIRNLVNDQLKRLVAHEGVFIAEGRDMATIVFPHADFQFYLDASSEIRARRRFEERPEGKAFDQILQSIEERDEKDRQKLYGALKISERALYIDTSYLTIQAVCDKVKVIIKNKNHQE